MKLLALLFFTTTLSITASSTQSKDADGWTTFSPKTRRFSILLPGSPKEKQEYLPLGSTKIDSYGAMFQRADAAFFILQIGDVPPEQVGRGWLDLLFENAYKLLLEYKTEDGRMEVGDVSRAEIESGGHRGYEYDTGCGPYKKHVRQCMTKLRVYKVGSSIYILGVSGPASQLPRVDIERFFSSFSVDGR